MDKKDSRINLRYKIKDLLNSVKKITLPGNIGFIGNYSNKDESINNKHFIEINQDTINKVIKELKIVLNINSEEGPIKYNISSIEDFKPKNIIENTFLKQIYEKILILEDLKVRILSNKKLELIMDKVNLSKQNDIDLKTLGYVTQSQEEYMKKAIDIFCSIEYTTESALLTINSFLKNEKEILDKNIDCFFKDPIFKQLESSWLGLDALIKNLETSEYLTISILDIKIEDLASDLSRNSLEKTLLYNELYNHKYGVLGAFPMTTIGLDYFIDSSNESSIFLDNISKLSKLIHCPVITGVHPSLLGVNKFEDLIGKDLKTIFNSPEMASYNGFRDNPNSIYIAAVLPRVLLRTPYKTNFFNETINDSEDYLWGNPAYFYSSIIGRSFLKTGWFNSISGLNNGGVIEKLPVVSIENNYGEKTMLCPVELAITDNIEYYLSNNMGLISICWYKNRNSAVVFSNSSVNKPKEFLDPESSSSNLLPSFFNNTLSVCYLCQIIKLFYRESIGSFASIDHIKNQISDFLSYQVLVNSDTAPQSIQAEFPLRGYSLVVTEDLGKPGNYLVDLTIKVPNTLQVMEVTISLANNLPVNN